MNTNDPSATSITASLPPSSLILSILQHALCQQDSRVVSSFEICQEIIQANARGYKVHVVLDPHQQTVTPITAATNPIVHISNSRRSDDDETNCQKVFVKLVRVSDYLHTKSDWNDLRRTLLYARTEARFYRDFLPLLLQQYSCSNNNATDATATAIVSTSAISPPCCIRMKIQSMFPRVYVATYDLDGYIPDEEEAATATSCLHAPPVLEENENCTSTRSSSRKKEDSTIATTPSLLLKGGYIVLDWINECTHYQQSPLTVPQSGLCVEAVAHLHVSAWQDCALLEKAQQHLSRASFHLRMRNPKELAGIPESWKHFAVAFHEHFQSSTLKQQDDDDDDEGETLLTTPRWIQLGQRIQTLAEYVSNCVSPGPRDPFATLIHGDYKAMNVFLPRHMHHTPILVDFASVGIGLGMSDLAMHIRHAVRPEDLENGEEEQLVRHYWEYLHTLLSESTGGSEDAAVGIASSCYTWDVAWRHYKLSLVDYFRFFLGRMWKNATPESMHQKANDANVSLINRHIPAAMSFLRTAERFLTEIEAEYESNSNSDRIGSE